MLTIHFLNVGHGDCTIIRHPSGRLTMVDINNAPQLDSTSITELSSQYPWQLGSDYFQYLLTDPTRRLQSGGYHVPLTDPVDFLHRNYPGQAIFRYIQSHPDLDHMRGLVALRQRGVPIVNFWDTDHSKVPEHYNHSDLDEWYEYLRLRDSGTDPKVLRLYRGARAPFYGEGDGWSDPGDGLEILSPTPELVRDANAAAKINDLSYVLRVNYAGRRIILGGDAEITAWDSIVGHFSGDLACDVLKASHHGRDSGYHQNAVSLMRPLLIPIPHSPAA